MRALVLWWVLCSVWLFAQQRVTVFAASDLKFALDTIVADFQKQHPEAKIDVIYGSSGKGKRQIERGAPFDLYFSANMDYVEDLYRKGLVASKPKLYAIGRLVLWSKSDDFNASKGFENLTAPWVHKIAIANPAHAPYGEKAKQALEHLHLYERLADKIVMGENISQTAGFISVKAADIGIIALSLVKAPTIADSPYHRYYLIDASLHEPLRQGYALTKHGASVAAAKALYEAIGSDKAKAILRRYGFSVEGK